MTKTVDFKSDEKKYSFGIAQKAIIYNPKEGKFLLVKTNDEYFGKKYGFWELVGGTVEFEEDFGKALEREIKEEAGDIEYEITGLVSKSEIENSDGKRKICLGFLVKLIDGEIELSEEHVDYKWEKAENIIKDKEHKPWLKDFIQKAQEKIDNEKNLDNLKRCMADFENFKKRQSELQVENLKYANQAMIMDIIPVIDNFHASTDHIPEESEKSPWVIGIMYIQKQLEKVLSDNGVEEIPAKVGDKFNPEIHEAVKDAGEETTKKDELKHKIKKVALKGYKLNGRVIRAARVIVE